MLKHLFEEVCVCVGGNTILGKSQHSLTTICVKNNFENTL